MVDNEIIKEFIDDVFCHMSYDEDFFTLDEKGLHYDDYSISFYDGDKEVDDDVIEKYVDFLKGIFNEIDDYYELPILACIEGQWETVDKYELHPSYAHITVYKEKDNKIGILVEYHQVEYKFFNELNK